MKSRVLSYCKGYCEVLLEKILEWAEHLKYRVKWKRSHTSNLIEVYCIDRRFINENFVQDFLREREKIIRNNRYRMSIRETEQGSEENVIGEVRLYRKKTFIHKATLITKSGETKNRLIYWDFKE
jgi:DNA-binding LacI/PurR family transcriptional regulator